MPSATNGRFAISQPAKPGRPRRPGLGRTVPVAALLSLALAAPAHAAAAPLLFQCDIWAGSSREHVRHMVAIDVAGRTVVDGPTHWRDGAWNSTFKHLVNFVQPLGGTLTWGDRDSRTQEAVVTFSLDLKTGRYRFVSPEQQLSHGTCRPVADTI